MHSYVVLLCAGVPAGHPTFPGLGLPLHDKSLAYASSLAYRRHKEIKTHTCIRQNNANLLASSPSTCISAEVNSPCRIMQRRSPCEYSDKMNLGNLWAVSVLYFMTGNVVLFSFYNLLIAGCSITILSYNNKYNMTRNAHWVVNKIPVLSYSRVSSLSSGSAERIMATPATLSESPRATYTFYRKNMVSLQHLRADIFWTQCP